MDADVSRHYASADEHDRLAGWSLERLRTEELLAGWLPAGGRVLDAGGGTGRYAGWLAARGHAVTLLDPVEEHVTAAAAAAAAATAGGPGGGPGGAALGGYGVERGDARALPHPGSCFDAVLLLGPLYHLVERPDRVGAVREALRVVRPGGPVVAAAISRPAALLDGFAKGHHADHRFRDVAAATLATGQHRNPTDDPAWFTTAYFHRPADLAAEMSDAGAGRVEVHGVEGPAWLWGDRGEEPDQPWWREAALWAARLAATDPDAMALSAHLLAVGWRP